MSEVHIRKRKEYLCIYTYRFKLTGMQNMWICCTKEFLWSLEAYSLQSRHRRTRCYIYGTSHLFTEIPFFIHYACFSSEEVNFAANPLEEPKCNGKADFRMGLTSVPITSKSYLQFTSLLMCCTIYAGCSLVAMKG